MTSLLEKFVGSQLRRNMASGVAVTMASTVVSFIAFPVYLHYLGAETYGLWVMLAIVISLAQLGALGIPEAVTKLVAEEHGRDNAAGIERCVTTALVMLCTIGLLMVLGIVALRHQIVGVFNLEPTHVAIALRFLPMIAVLSLYILVVEAFVAVLSGLGRMDQANYIRSAGRIATPVMATVLLVLGLGLKSLLIANVFSSAIIHIIGFICIRSHMRIRLLNFHNWDTQWVSRILHFGGAVSGLSLIRMFMGPFNKIIIARYIGLDAVPVYEIGYQVSMRLHSLFHTLFRALLPEISREGGRRTPDALDYIRHLNHRSLKFILKYAFPVYLLIALAATPLLKVWLGEAFIEMMPNVLRVLLVAMFFSLVGIPSYYTILGLGYLRKNLLASFIQSSINVTLILLFLSMAASFCVLHVVFGILVGIIVANLYLIYASRDTLNRLQVQFAR